MFIYSNNKLIPEHQFSISYKNRAFRYGDGVFETIKVRKGIPLFLKHHYSRLILALDTFQFEIPEHWTYSFFVHTIVDLANQNEIENGNLRIQVSRLGEGKYLPTSNGCDLMMEIHPSNKDAYILSNDEVCLGIFAEIPKVCSRYANFKSVNSQIYVQAALFKQKNQLDEVLILNEQGRVADAGSSNVFISINNILICPPNNEGGIDGVLRRVLVKLCKQNKIELQQVPISLTDIEDAEEIFVTNVIQGIKPITRYKKKSLTVNYSRQLHQLLIIKEAKELDNFWI